MAKARRVANGDGSLYYRKSDKRWVGSFIVNGKRRYVYSSVGGKREEARDKLRKAQQEAEQGTLVEPSKLRVKDYLTDWLSIHGPSIKDSSCTNYRYQIDAHLIPALGHIPLQKLTPAQIQKCYAGLLEEGLKASSIHSLHIVFKSALADAVEWDKIGRNPCDKVKLPRKEKRDIMPLTQDQARSLLQAATGHWLEGLLTLALATGMRQGELLALHWHDIDFERGIVQVRRSLSYVQKRGISEEEPKTAHSRRSIQLAAFAIDALKRHRTAQIKARWQEDTKWQEKGLVFCNHWGGYLWRVNVHAAFKRLLERATLPAIRFHDLRHTAAVALIMKGVHAKVIQEILGHSSITVTMDIYGHVFPSMQRDAMTYMDDFLRAM
jgi:integrase